MTNQKANALHVGGRISGAGAILSQSAGGFTVAHGAGTGIYAVTLSEPIDAAECSILQALHNSPARQISSVNTSDTVVTFTITNLAGAATDEEFSFQIFRNVG